MEFNLKQDYVLFLRDPTTQLYGHGYVFLLNCLINSDLKWSQSFLVYSAAGWWSCFDCGALWQLAAQGVIVPPQGLRKTAVEAWTAVNHVVDHTNQEEERQKAWREWESREGDRESGREERKERVSGCKVWMLSSKNVFLRLRTSFFPTLNSSFHPLHLLFLHDLTICLGTSTLLLLIITLIYKLQVNVHIFVTCICGLRQHQW